MQSFGCRVQNLRSACNVQVMEQCHECSECEMLALCSFLSPHGLLLTFSHSPDSTVPTVSVILTSAGTLDWWCDNESVYPVTASVTRRY